MAKLDRKIETDIPEVRKKPGRILELKTPEELVDEWIESAKGDIDRPLTTCMPTIDRDLRHKLRGSVAAYIGKGGSKKSLLALQGCRRNVITYENNCTGIYSNMEMGIFQFVSRLINMTIDEPSGTWGAADAYDFEFTEHYKNRNNEGMEKIRKEIKDFFRERYGNNLLINSQGSMTIEDYAQLIKQAKETTGHIDELDIDGLSMMASAGNENDTFTIHTKELKDLAKQENIFIKIICHVTKACEKHARDLQPYVRGSEKILDNVDFVVMMSQIIDQQRSSPKNIKYMTDKGWIQFYNKRGTGNIIDLIYDFDPKTLLLTESIDLPSTYEVDLNSNNNW
jgi:hypothetical protein